MKHLVHDFARELRKKQTEAEIYFWQKVRKKRILNSAFLRQKVIEHAEILGKRSFFIVDFYCSKKRLIVEIDGDVHNEQIEYDKIREATLIEMGFSIIRFLNHEVLNNWDNVEEKLKEKISELQSRY